LFQLVSVARIGLILSLLSLLPASFAAAAPALLHRDHPLAGSLWDTRSGQRVEPRVLLAEAAEVRWVLLGEKHDNAEHHRLQAWVVDRLGRLGGRRAVVWEMAEPEHAATLGAASLDTVDGLGAAIEWESRGWPAWQDYLPIAEAALIHRMALRPGKPSRDLVRRIGKGTALPADLAARLNWQRRLPAGEQDELLEELAVSHCGALSEAALGPMAEVQQFWDAWMADAMQRATAPPLAAKQVILIAGSGHVRKDRAVPWRLPGRSLSLAPVEVVAGEPVASDYPSFDAALFDYVWFTPRVDEKDPCAAFAQ
jgi:uncharacterized iron-regulated protein